MTNGCLLKGWYSTQAKGNIHQMTLQCALFEVLWPIGSWPMGSMWSVSTLPMWFSSSAWFAHLDGLTTWVRTWEKSIPAG